MVQHLLHDIIASCTTATWQHSSIRHNEIHIGSALPCGLGMMGVPGAPGPAIGPYTETMALKLYTAVTADIRLIGRHCSMFVDQPLLLTYRISYSAQRTEIRMPKVQICY